jgi:hypothetical protein
LFAGILYGGALLYKQPPDKHLAPSSNSTRTRPKGYGTVRCHYRRAAHTGERLTTAAEEVVTAVATSPAPRPLLVAVPRPVSVAAPRLVAELPLGRLMKASPSVFRAAPRSADPLSSPVPLSAGSLYYFGSRVQPPPSWVTRLLPSSSMGAQARSCFARRRTEVVARPGAARPRRLPPRRP